MKMRKIFGLFTLMSLLGQMSFANEGELKDILKAYVDGSIAKEDVLFHIKKTDFPRDVRDIEITTNKYGVKTVRWHFSLSTSAIMRQVASTYDQNELLKVVDDFRVGKITKEKVLSYLKETNFPYEVVDIVMAPNAFSVQDVRWSISIKKSDDALRDPASDAKVEFAFEKKGYESTSNKAILVEASYGLEEVKSLTETLEYTSMRASVSYKHELSDTYDIIVKAGISQFQGLKYSNSSDNIKSSSPSPEFGLAVSRTDGYLISSLGYDFRKAFFVREVGSTGVATKQSLHKIFYDGTYMLNDRFGVGANAGYVMDQSVYSLSGFDYGLSGIYRFGSMNAHFVGLHYKASSLSETKGQEEFKASYLSANIGFGF